MHVVLRFRAPALLAATALLVAGCATGPGLEKSHSLRRTVAAGEGQNESTDPSTSPTAQANKPVDPAFAVEKLRLVNPCALIEKEVLQTVGTPSSTYSSTGYTRCSNSMKNADGKRLTVSVEIGVSLASYELKKATKKVAGLASTEQTVNDSCFLTVVTQENPALGVKVQATSDGSFNACEATGKIMEGVIRKLKGNPSKYQPPKASPVEVEPCDLLDRSAFTALLGSSPRQQAYGLHQCGWYSSTGQLEVGFRTATIPRDGKFGKNQTEIDLGGGQKAYQVVKDNSFPSCDVIVIRTQTDKGAGELAEFTASGAKDKTFDRCAQAVAFAKSVLPKLPK